MGAVVAVPMADDPQITQITTHTINILRVAEGQRQAAVDRLQELQGEITTLLEKSEKLSPNRLNRLKALEDQTNASISQAYQDISGTHTAGLKKLATIEAKQAQKLVNTKIGVNVVSVAIPEKLLEAVVDGPHIFGNSAKGWWGAQAQELQQTFKTGMQQGVLLGETVDQLAARVRGTKANNYEDGMMALKRRQAQALVRSSAISIANEARLRQFAEMGDLVKGIQWVATLDTRTTAKCRALDGKMWRLPDYEPVGHDKAWPGPTAHWNCRSTQIAVLRSWEELSGKKLPTIDDETLEQRMKEILAGQGMSQDQIDKVRANTRASMDGQVSDGLDFEGWLRLQPDSRVESILGPGRAALWKAGKLTVSDMTDQTNRPLTLDQLEQLVEKGGTAPETLGVQFLPMVSQSVFLSAKTEAELNKKAAAEIEQIQEDAAAAAVDQPVEIELTEEQKKAAIAAMKKLDEVDDDSYEPPLKTIPYDDVPKQLQDLEYKVGKPEEMAKILEGVPITKIDPGTLVTWQGIVWDDRLRKIIDSKTAINLPVLVFRKGGVDYVIDGNHRAAVGVLAKLPFINAHVIDLDAPAKSKPAVTPPDTSAETIAAILASPAGQTLKAKWIQKIQKENPEMAPKDVLANATQQALMEQASKSKAAALSTAKKKLLAGQELTPALKKTIDSLTPEEAANFNEAVKDAQAAAGAAKAAAQAKALAKLTEVTANGGMLDDETAAILQDVDGASMKEAIAAGEQQKKAAQDLIDKKLLTMTMVQAAAASNDPDAISKIPKADLDLLSGDEYGDAITAGEKIKMDAEKAAKAAAAKKAEILAAIKNAGQTGGEIEYGISEIFDNVTQEEYTAAFKEGKTLAQAQAAAKVPLDYTVYVPADGKPKGDLLSELYADYPGQTTSAFDNIETAITADNAVLVLKDSVTGKIIGGAGFDNSGTLTTLTEINHIGSLTPGAGSAVVKEIAKKASGGLVVFDPYPSSEPFWTKLGFEKKGGSTAWILPQDKTQALAKAPADPNDPGGPTPTPPPDDSPKVVATRPGGADKLAIPQMFAMAKVATHHLKDADGTVVAVGEKKSMGHVIAPKSLHLQKVSLAILKDLKASGAQYYQMTAGGGEFPNGQQSLSIGPNNYPIDKAIADHEASIAKLQALEPKPAPAKKTAKKKTPAIATTKEAAIEKIYEAAKMGKPLAKALKPAEIKLIPAAELSDAYTKAQAFKPGAAPQGPTPAAVQPSYVAPPKKHPETAIIPPTPPERRPVEFPKAAKEVSSLKVVKRLGGSTGAELVEYKGKQYVRKKGASVDHVRSEFIADRIYEALGLDVPQGALYEDGDKVWKLTEFRAGKELGQLSGKDLEAAAKVFRQGFVADVLLGNWDVLGAGKDNVLWDGKSLIRIDNGGSLNFRAMGTPKTQAEWTGIPREIFTMRDRGTAPQVAELMGNVDLHALAPSLKALRPEVLDLIEMPQATREVLKERMRNLRDLGYRAGEFSENSFDPRYTETHAKAMYDIRERGMDMNLMGETTVQGYAIKDNATGRAFGNLRSQGGGVSRPAAALLPGDTFGPTIEAAVKTINHKLKDDMTNYNQAKITAAFATKPALKAMQKNGTPEQKVMAKQYLGFLDMIDKKIDAANSGDFSALPLFSTYKPKQAPAAAPAPTISVVDDLHKMLQAQGVPADVIDLHAQWNKGQGNNSWSNHTLIAKYWMSQVARKAPQGEHYWDGNNIRRQFSDAKDAWDAAVKKHGQENVEKVFAAHHAMLMEQLERVGTDWVDRENRVVLLLRTESTATLKANGISNVKKGDVIGLKLGATESHSMNKPTYVFGEIMTAKMVPFSRVLYNHWFEPTAGSGQSGFLGDGENEWAADGSGIPSVVLDTKYTSSAHPLTPSRNKADWIKAGVPDYTDTFQTGKIK